MNRHEPHFNLDRSAVFGQWLTQSRLSQHLRQADLAARLGINPGRISEFEVGHQVPSPDLLRQMESVLDSKCPLESTEAGKRHVSLFDDEEGEHSD